MTTITANMKVAKINKLCPESARILLIKDAQTCTLDSLYMLAQLMSVRNAARVHRTALEPFA